MSLIFFYVIIFAGFVFLSGLCNWLFLSFSKNLGIRQGQKDEKRIRWAADEKPALGGISFFILFLIAIAILGFIPLPNIVSQKYTVGLTIACSLGFLIGLWDDAFNTNPLVKFIGQFCCAAILVIADIQVMLVGASPSVNVIFTILWVVGLMNSINMLDNMDGIASIASCVAILGCIVVNVIHQGADLYSYLLCAVLASLVGFLIFNWYPAKIYMGDSGSQFLGVFLASISILIVWNPSNEAQTHNIVKQFIAPTLVFFIPIIDTITVTVRRIMRKKSPFIGGRDHITHHLAYLGFREDKVVLLLGLMGLLSVGILGVLLRTVTWTPRVSIAILIYMGLVFSFIQILYNKARKKINE